MLAQGEVVLFHPLPSLAMLHRYSTATPGAQAPFAVRAHSAGTRYLWKPGLVLNKLSVH